ncbi:MAG: uracil-DNA glycosylase [Candidatus Brocadia sp. WS118]|nr:MAG: uracil-DNA glycosylase [Candidatus Brocadia sp. WS118]
MEKGFGIDTLTLSKPVTECSSRSAKSSTKNKPIEHSTTGKHPGDQTSVTGKGERIQILEALQNEMLVCHKCLLGKTRTHLVFGSGNPEAHLMFVGEAPGRDEDLQGEPFVGRAGQLLTKIIEAIGLKRSDVYIANVLKCRPPGNRNPLPEEIVLCMPYLLKQIEIIQPKVLCALGTFAAQTLLNTKAPVGTLRGRFHDYNGIPMMVTFHPAYLLRNPNDKAKVWEDMKKVRDFLGELSGKDSKR